VRTLSAAGRTLVLRDGARPGLSAGQERATFGGPRRTGGPAAAAKDTLTVTGTTIGGQPADGQEDVVWLASADNPDSFNDFGSSQSMFHDGVTHLRVPPGHYWAIGDFTKNLPKEQSWDEYLDVLPEFTVSGDTTVHLAAAAATSQLQTVTPRPAIEGYSTFQFIRTATAGPAVSIGWLETDGGPKIPAPQLYISPTHAVPATGKLATVTTEELGSTAQPGTSRYLYEVGYQSAGRVTAQRHVLSQDSLATLHLRYYSAHVAEGLTTTLPAFPVQGRVCSFGGAVFGGLRFPARQTDYLLTGPALSWQTDYIQDEAADYSGGQVGPAQSFVPGESLTEDFGAYPLHPAPDMRLEDIAGQPPVQVSASRAGNTLRLAMTAFSDSVPGHLGQGTFPPVRTAGSYTITQNGTKIGGGTLAHFTGALDVAATLRPGLSVIRFRFDASEASKLNPLSTASQTVWTWRSAPPAAGARVPAGWTCLPGGAVSRSCAVQPMMTLRYDVAGMGLSGSVRPGQQVVLVSAGHLQLAAASRITGARVQVSFDGGKTWRTARVSGQAGRYAAVFAAPPGALVTLRTSATDAAGGSVTETIVDAYQVAG
jgi:hypothetical protein